MYICPNCKYQSKTNEKFCCRCGSEMVEKYVCPWWFFLIAFFVAFFVIIIPFPDNRFFAVARPVLFVAALLIPLIISVIINVKKKTTADSRARNNGLKVHEGDNNEDYQMEPYAKLTTDNESIEKRISPTIDRAIYPTQETIPKIVYSICPNCKHESDVGEESYCCKCGAKMLAIRPKKKSRFWLSWFGILVLGLVLSIVVSCGSKSIGFPFLGMFLVLLWGSTLLYSWRRNDWILFFSCLGIAALLFGLKLQGDRLNEEARKVYNATIRDLDEWAPPADVPAGLK